MAHNKVVIKALAFTSLNASTSISDSKSPRITSAYTPDNVLITKSVLAIMVNCPTALVMTSTTHTSVSTSLTTQGCEIILKIIVHINLLFIIVF